MQQPGLMRFLQQIISKLRTVLPRPAKPCHSQHKWAQRRTTIIAEEGVSVETDNGFSDFWMPVPFQEERLCYFINCFEVNITPQKIINTEKSEHIPNDRGIKDFITFFISTKLLTLHEYNGWPYDCMSPQGLCWEWGKPLPNFQSEQSSKRMSYAN